MDTYQTILSIRSVRQFDLSRPIDEAALHRILQAGRMSGSSKDSQPWWFIVIRDRDRLHAVAQTGDYAQHVAGAAFAVAIVFDPQFYRGEFDSGRTAQNMMLAAWGDGIASCPTSMHHVECAREALGLSEEFHVSTVIGFGYRARAPKHVPEAARLPIDEYVRRNRW